MFRLGPTELIIILVIVLLVFGVGRIAQVGREMGTGIREFRKGLSGEDEKTSSSDDQTKS